MDERVIKWADEHDRWCNYCKYSYECSGGVSGSPNGPTYPPCADGDLDMFLDEDELIEAIENGEE